MDEVTLESTEAIQETTSDYEAVTLADVTEITANLAHVNLFGSFLICGTLVGLILFRRWQA